MNIITQEDIKKLDGCTISNPSLIAGPDPILRVVLQHPAMEHPVQLDIRSTVSFGRSGNVMLCNPTPNFNATEILSAENTDD